MAIADTITSMQTHTSNAYTMIGYGTDLTGINKNLENLSTSIFNAFLEALRNPDTLFTNLPKITGSGSNITLNDTANAPMRIELGASELTQAGTPTPSSPQDIHTISGSNTIKVCGSNLINEIIENSRAWNNGIISNVNGFSRTDYIEVKPSTSYYIQHTMGNNVAFVGWWYDTNKTPISNISLSGDYDISSSVISPNNAKYVIINFYNTTIATNPPMLNEGSTALPYEPYVSQEQEVDLGEIEYCKISTYEDKFIRTSGKNLFDANNVIKVDNKILNDSGVETNDSTGGYTKMYIPVQPNTQYTISGLSSSGSKRVYYFDNSKTFISRSNAEATSSRTFTTPSNCYFVDFQYYISNNDFNTYMLNKGSTALDYEPYGSNEWYIKKNIGKYQFTGNESWLDYPNPPEGYYKAYSTNVMLGRTNSGEPYLYCDYFRNEFYGSVEGIMLTKNATYLSFQTSTASTPAEVKSWITEHKPTIYYILATPTYTQITGTLASQLENVYKNMLSQEGQTNISQVNNDLAFELSVQAIENLD